jgi:hypothetical protein
MYIYIANILSDMSGIVHELQAKHPDLIISQKYRDAAQEDKDSQCK